MERKKLDEGTNKDAESVTKSVNENEIEGTFSQPKPKRTKRRFTTLSIILTTQNRFEILPTIDKRKDRTKENEYDEDKKENKTSIVLRAKEKWTNVSKLVSQKKISYFKATATKEGIKIYPQTITDYTKMYNPMKENDLQFHTHQLREDKNLKVVIKGISDEMPVEDVVEDLNERGYPIIKATRMNRKKPTLTNANANSN